MAVDEGMVNWINDYLTDRPQFPHSIWHSFIRSTYGAIIKGLMKSEAFDVQVKDESNHTCIHASMSVNFTIKYETESGTNKSISFVAPDDVTTSGSTCGSSEAAALLVVNFMNNHSWSVNFTRDSTVYSIDVIVFTYNTNDSTLFPDAKRKGLLTTATSVNDPIPINATYTCVQHKDIITENVVQDYWNVSLLAYAQDVTVIRDFHCSEDLPTTHAPTTTTTPTPSPKPEDKPSTGNYSVISGNETCLMATMGLQLNASVFVGGHNVWKLFNINPNATISSGSWISHISNNNLSFWEASVGKSYLCHKEQLLVVSKDLSINTFEVRVQPFGIHNATYDEGKDVCPNCDNTIGLYCCSA
ncbi:unnamed protein product [Ranitomeya imitator]|uniref:Lysosome-associated membrane glycoprotein 2-like luminal domain-containing protein n=1 Tax=Ranitomeya imitator TaxID=111125 RepID=A0ABN9L9V5_9NEOB|nr:unnamed protein product [Ranitomeya imitator]